MSTIPPSPTTRRADHQRNRTALLAAARLVFAELGADASIEEIVRRAGFAKGTFFRHFATKQTLVQALLTDRLVKLADLAREVNSTYEPGWRAVCQIMERLLEYLSGDRSLSEFIERDWVQSTPEIQCARLALAEEIDRAVRAAQAAGEIRADIAGADFPPIVLMISRATLRRHVAHPGLGQRYLRLFLDGIRSGQNSDLGASPLGEAELGPTATPDQAPRGPDRSA